MVPALKILPFVAFFIGCLRLDSCIASAVASMSVATASVVRVDYVVAPTTADTEAFERLKSVVSESKGARTFKLLGSCNACKNIGLSLSKLPERVFGEQLSNAQLKRLKRALTSEHTYIFGASHSCSEPFAPDSGIEFDMDGGGAALLTMRSCAWGRLVLQNEIPFYLYNFRKPALSRIRNALKAVH
jgi:hypothetical protein